MLYVRTIYIYVRTYHACMHACCQSYAQTLTRTHVHVRTYTRIRVCIASCSSSFFGITVVASVLCSVFFVCHSQRSQCFLLELTRTDTGKLCVSCKQTLKQTLTCFVISHLLNLPLAALSENFAFDGVILSKVHTSMNLADPLTKGMDVSSCIKAIVDC